MNTIDLEEKYILPTYARRDIEIIKGNGVYLYDKQGNEYLDFMTNYGANILGHNCAAVSVAIQEQSKTLISLHCSFYNDKRALAAEKLVQITPCNLTKVYFSNSGTESVEAAIKFAWAATGKRGIISAKLGYHGKTIASLSATTSSPKYRKPFLPLIPGFSQVSYNDEEALKAAVSNETAAVILEPIQGESGIRPATKEYLRSARDICEDKDVLLIFDEVQTGLRTGKWTASEHYGVEPDIMCLSKSIANGVPMGVTLVTEQLSEKMYKGIHSCTFGGNPLACTASLATLNYIENNRLLEKSAAIGNYFMDELRKINSSLVREVRGEGLMIALDLKKKCGVYLKKLQEKGILAAPAASTVIRFLPSLIIEKEHADTVVSALNEALN